MFRSAIALGVDSSSRAPRVTSAFLEGQVASLTQFPRTTLRLGLGAVREESDFDARAQLHHAVRWQAKVGGHVAGVARHPGKDRASPGRKTELARRENRFAANEIGRPHRIKAQSGFFHTFERSRHIRFLHKTEMNLRAPESFAPVFSSATRSLMLARYGTSSVRTVSKTTCSCSTLLCLRLWSNASGVPDRLPDMKIAVPGTRRMLWLFRSGRKSIERKANVAEVTAQERDALFAT